MGGLLDGDDPDGRLMNGDDPDPNGASMDEDDPNVCVSQSWYSCATFSP